MTDGLGRTDVIESCPPSSRSGGGARARRFKFKWSSTLLWPVPLPDLFLMKFRCLSPPRKPTAWSFFSASLPPVDRRMPSRNYADCRGTIRFPFDQCQRRTAGSVAAESAHRPLPVAVPPPPANISSVRFDLNRTMPSLSALFCHSAL